ncbi:lipopolysaccharide-induced tumor necrosis factor-alpha factor homolog [Copidosoma floridanum]|uniref:lipopolysaccharide-induced tumor necrosis factor-alpha factor homolog n=1 Tax=Copidosoma floridanum TaxID=29053 RepID=UPI0006C9667B|nr:lipopolysaccharide-induced tumor necrosis factor-alpha factor homolog [Copidosoma floridanum]XP_014207393.1 lipopolysaccharide-induced tumor necrosis factor-alpha factor homolog [Copidosoma floridanum]
MEKEEAAAASASSMAREVNAPVPSAPPSAPPSYEEAIGLIPGAVPNVLQPGMAPYPLVPAQPMPMVAPMTTNYAPTLVAQPQVQSAAQSQAPGVRIIHQQTVHITMGPNPIKMSCPSCHKNIKTTTTSDHQPVAHICCIVLCLFGCCLCSCLPYCLSAFMNVHHFCPNCKAYIGTWKG